MPTKKYRIRLTTDEQQELKVARLPWSDRRVQADARAHPADERRGEGRRRNEGRRHIRCARCGTVNGRAGAPALCGGRHRVGVEPQKATAPPSEETGRRARSPVDSDGLRGTAGEVAPVGPLKLLADQLVECEIVETISTETVRQVLKKKRTQAVAEAELVHPSRSERGVCVRDGRRAGSLPTAV